MARRSPGTRSNEEPSRRISRVASTSCWLSWVPTCTGSGSDCRPAITPACCRTRRPSTGDIRAVATGRRSWSSNRWCGPAWRRASAKQRLEPHLRCFECLRADATLADTLPGSRRPRVDVTTGLTLDLVPVWFDGEAARQVLTPVGNVIASMEKPHAAGTRIYFATLALAAGEPQKAEQALSGLQGLTPLRGIVDAQSALQRGDADKAVRDLSLRLPDLDRQDRPLALYWLGLSRLTGSNAGNRQEGLLNLLEIPALFADQQPELAAAGLYEAMREMAKAGDAKGSIAVRRELLDRYGQTWHAVKTRADDEKAKN